MAGDLFLNNAWWVGLITAWRIWIFARGLKENLKICFMAENLASGLRIKF